jgi:hypothetical protein
MFSLCKQSLEGIISNKMGHGVITTHMANALVLVDYGIKISQ